MAEAVDEDERLASAAAVLVEFGHGGGLYAGSMDTKVSLAEKLAAFAEPWRPRIVAYLNDLKIQVVKTKGEFVWHSHEDTDDFFLVLAGRLTIQMRDRDVELGPGELFVVPRGVEHCPKADEEAHVLLIEPAGTVNTGEAGGALTAPEEEI
jgi:mannose-6-phosphate isomerase-like protein (cupin superfamily)